MTRLKSPKAVRIMVDVLATQAEFAGTIEQMLEPLLHFPTAYLPVSKELSLFSKSQAGTVLISFEANILINSAML